MQSTDTKIVVYLFASLCCLGRAGQKAEKNKDRSRNQRDGEKKNNIGNQ